jgi:hypothetical protein
MERLFSRKANIGRYCHRYNFVTVAGPRVEMYLGDLPGV